MSTERKLLLQWEVAQRLRCSTSKVKRLRLSGELAYLPGRPILIDEADVEAYLEGVRQRERKRNRETTEDAAARAFTIWRTTTVREQMKALASAPAKVKK